MAAASQPRYLKQYSGQIDSGIEPACVSSRGRTTLGGVHAGMYRVLTETHPGTSVTQSAYAGYAGYAILTNPGQVNNHGQLGRATAPVTPCTSRPTRRWPTARQFSGD
ncbi:MAG: hypothetical protein ACSLFJ_07655 [Immundisolibacter sp.]|uniref:hypothetical protein n=1 Tax=Immundisolibacter sp. TaxID=1934948 RepID=UPI003EE1C029